MTSTSTPHGRSGVRRSAIVGVVAGLTIGGGVALVAGLPSGLGALGTGGVATSENAAADPSMDGTPIDATDDQAAEHEAHVRDALAPLVADGTLTDAQVDAVVAALAAAGPMGRDGDMHGDMHGGPSLDAVAELLGISVDDIRTALADGQSLADVAAAHGSTAQAVVDVLVADLSDHLDDEVASGEHTRAEADQRLADATERITAMVNGEMPADGAPFGGPRPGGPGGMRGGPHGDHRDDSGNDSDSGNDN